MKTKSALLRSTVALLALLVFIALPISSARASDGQCGDVDISWEYAGMNQIYFELTVEPSDCVLYVTTTIDDPTFDDPSRSGATPNYPTFTCASGSTFYIPYGHTRYIKAFAWKSRWTQSVNLSSDEQHNPNL
jgi:hypothetical protein